MQQNSVKRYHFHILAFAGIVASVGRCQPATQSALNAPIRSLAIDQKSFDQALAEVVRQSGARFVVGFEPAAETSSPSGMRLRMVDTTVEQAMSALCALDRRYTLSESSPGVIEVRPFQEIPELQAILNLPVAPLEIQTREWPDNLFTKLSELVPELAAYLDSKISDWAKATGRRLPGTANITMSTDVSPPQISLRIGPTTVRGVLDSLAAYTLEHATDRTAALYLPARGWRAEFTRDKEAPTGLGGYVRFSAFP
jgi:hypothetical protein